MQTDHSCELHLSLFLPKVAPINHYALGYWMLGADSEIPSTQDDPMAREPQTALSGYTRGSVAQSVKQE